MCDASRSVDSFLLDFLLPRLDNIMAILILKVVAPKKEVVQQKHCCLNLKKFNSINEKTKIISSLDQILMTQHSIILEEI